MILKIFSVYDAATQAYVKPFYELTKMAAMRSFSEACGQADHQMHKHAKDYHLVFLGEFDDGSAEFKPVYPERLISAVECLKDRES